ncbi:hypothetical protein [Novosphingobium resinovorum]
MVGLASLVERELRLDPFSGMLFLPSAQGGPDQTPGLGRETGLARRSDCISNCRFTRRRGQQIDTS